MPKKIGDGGYGIEEYNEIDGKYSADGKPNNDGKLSSSDKKILENGLNLDDDDLWSDENLLEAERQLLDEEIDEFIKAGLIKVDTQPSKIEEEEEEYDENLEEQTFNESSCLDDFIKKLTSAFAPKPQQQSTKQYVRHDGETYTIPKEKIEQLEKHGWLNDYEIKEIDVKQFVESKGLNNPQHGVFFRRQEMWGQPQDYHYDEEKAIDEVPIRITSNGAVIDGNHRLFALYNDGYSKAQVLVHK